MNPATIEPLGGPIPARRPRPIWLTVVCLLLWLAEALLFIALSPLIGAMLLGLAFGSPRLEDWIPVFIPALAALLLTIATIGMWRMKRWGAALLTIYTGLDLIRLMMHVPLPFALFILGIVLVDTNTGHQTAVEWSTTHGVLIGLLWLASLILWRRRSLT